ncbi:hypothetical protein [Chryseobacterium aquaticum]|uniref:hypothetical protein n=1 Tax=Chryseobacterium aquaticum TaxID=452084 RepID=UPI002FC9A879
MEEISAFEEFEKKDNLARRRSLLPIWIKIFTWLFLIGGAVAIGILICGFFLTNINLEIYGIQASHPYTLTGFSISILLIYKGFVAYRLWFQEKWAPRAAIIDGIMGIAICIIMMIIIPFTHSNINFTIRLELIPLYFYLQKMQKIKPIWKNI